MTLAAAHASKFYEEVVSADRVFTLVEDDSFLVFPIRDKEVVAFWSSRSRVERVQSLHPRYRSYSIDELSLAQFLSQTLPYLEKRGISIGVNWSGKRLTGYDLEVADLVKNISYWQNR